MNKYAVLLILVFCSFSALTAKTGKKLRANLSYTTFYTPQDGPYIETYLSINAASIRYLKNENGKFQGAVDIMLLFKKNDTVVAYDKKSLLSPEVADTLNTDFSFFDIQRFLLPTDAYIFDLTIADKNSALPAVNIKQDVEINYNATDPMISGIELIESYKKTEKENILTKSGYDMLPFTTSFLGSDVSKFIFYAEIYNIPNVLKDDDKYIMSYYIKPAETGAKLEEYTRIKRETAKPVTVVFNELDISMLPSGNYYFCIECRDRENKLLTFNSLYFQRSNPNVRVNIDDLLVNDSEFMFTSKIRGADTLREYMRSLRPIAKGTEMNYLTNRAIDSMGIDLMQRFFYNFWLERDQNNPELAWVNYSQEVAKVNKNYGNQIQKGYDTDRGRVYLQYGPPDVIVDRKFDASSWDGRGYVPYEIWQYYALLDQRNRKFVFSNPNLAHNTYILLHSDARGELYNPNWETELERSTYRTGNSDKKNQLNRSINESSPREWFDNPY